MRWLLGKTVTPETVISEGAVGIEGEILRYVGPEQQAPRNPHDPTRRVEGWVTPGLIDLHLHGAGGWDLMEATPQALRSVGHTLVAHGTTSYLATSVVCRGEGANRHLEVAAELCQDEDYSAQILGIHVEGPYVSPTRAGLIRSDRIWPPDQEDLNRLLRITRGSLRMMTLAPELPGMLDLLPVLEEAGAIGSMGHTEATFAQARAGFASGIKHVTHLYNAMRGLHHREPGALGAALLDHGVTAQLIVDGVHVHPALLHWTAEVFSFENLVLITDALPSAGLSDGVYTYDGRPYVAEGGTAWHLSGDALAGPVKGALFGTTLLLDEMVRRAVDLMRVTFPQAVRMASLNPARTLGLEGRIGRLAAGLEADLVFWNDSFQVVETMVRGQTVWEREGRMSPARLKE